MASAPTTGVGRVILTPWPGEKFASSAERIQRLCPSSQPCACPPPGTSSTPGEEGADPRPQLSRTSSLTQKEIGPVFFPELFFLSTTGRPLGWFSAHTFPANKYSLPAYPCLVPPPPSVFFKFHLPAPPHSDGELCCRFWIESIPGRRRKTDLLLALWVLGGQVGFWRRFKRLGALWDVSCDVGKGRRHWRLNVLLGKGFGFSVNARL